MKLLWQIVVFSERRFPEVCRELLRNNIRINIDGSASLLVNIVGEQVTTHLGSWSYFHLKMRVGHFGRGPSSKNVPALVIATCAIIGVREKFPLVAVVCMATSGVFLRW